jgi:DNA-binding NarL/FixJ family response regulator
LIVWMPGVRGLLVKKELQAISPKTRVIIITANEDDSVRTQAMQGFAGPSPYSLSHLMTTSSSPQCIRPMAPAI